MKIQNYQIGCLLVTIISDSTFPWNDWFLSYVMSVQALSIIDFAWAFCCSSFFLKYSFYIYSSKFDLTLSDESISKIMHSS